MRSTLVMAWLSTLATTNICGLEAAKVFRDIRNVTRKVTRKAVLPKLEMIWQNFILFFN